jgi:hypothetical protein
MFRPCLDGVRAFLPKPLKLDILSFDFLVDCAKSITDGRGKSRADGKGNAVSRDAHGRTSTQEGEQVAEFFQDFATASLLAVFFSIFILIPLAPLLGAAFALLAGAVHILGAVIGFLSGVNARKPAAQTPQQPDTTFPNLPM